MRVHAGEIDIDVDLVHALVAGQFPELSDQPIVEVRSTGTVNAVYRIGERLYSRLPRVAHWVADLDREWQWLPQLAPRLSLPIPQPVARGRPSGRYPFPWAIYRWLEGETYADGLVDDETEAARDLARFVAELRGIDPAGAPRGGRKPLRELDRDTREVIDAARGVIDAEAALAAWRRSLEAPVWDGTPGWIHSDLLRPNVLVVGGRISAVLDFGGAGIGDPASDVIAAWSVFGPAGREAYRDALDVDDGTWHRARGIALHQAAVIIPYYAVSNPRFVALAQRTVEEIIADQS